jgi:2-keto-4-pentenoate hydratase
VIHRGDIILAGALGPAHPAVPGNYTARFGSLGEITFTLR